MSPEQLKSPVSTLSTREFLQVAGLTAASIFAGLPFHRLDNTLRAFGAMLDRKVDCYTPPEQDQSEYDFDAIVVLGGGIERLADGSHTPNEFQKLRLEAAAVAVANGFAPKVILLDGAMEQDVDPELDKKYLQKEVLRISRGKKELSSESVIIDRLSLNTATNLQELHKIMERFNLKNVIIITNFFHIPRADLAACVNNINAYPQPAEDLIGDYFPQREEKIDEFYRNNPAMLFLYRKEKWAILESIIDPYGILPSYIKKFIQEQDFEEMYYQLLSLLQTVFS